MDFAARMRLAEDTLSLLSSCLWIGALFSLKSVASRDQGKLRQFAFDSQKLTAHANAEARIQRANEKATG